MSEARLKWVGRGVLVVMFVGLAAATAATAGRTDQAQTDEVKVGAFVWTRGTLKTFGAQALAGIKQAVIEVNRNGGILGGRKVKLIVYEEGLDAETTTKSVRQAKSDGVAGIVGFADATSGTVAASVSDRLGLPIVIAGSGSGTFVVNNKRQDLVHVLTYPEAVYPGVVKWMKEMRFDSVAQVAYDSAYSRVAELTYRRAFKGTNVSFPKTIYVPYGQADVSQATAQAVASNPDLLVFDIWGGATVGALKRLKELGYKGRIVQAQVSMVDQEMKAAGSAACGFLDTEQFLADPKIPRTSKWIADFKRSQRGATLGGQTETFYEGAMIMLRALNRAKTTTDRAAIGKAMRSVNFLTPRGVKMQILPSGQVYISRWYLVRWNCSKGKREIFRRLELPKSNFAPGKIIIP